MYSRISFYHSTTAEVYELTSNEAFNNAPLFAGDDTTNMTLVIHLSQSTMSGLSSVMDVTQKDTLFLRVQRNAFFDSQGKVGADLSYIK